MDYIAALERALGKRARTEMMPMQPGDVQATCADTERLAQAAKMLSSAAGGLSMRTLQTIEKINPDPSKTVIFALPVEVLEGIKAISQNIKQK